uniref:Uncharacterized protein n=1 Tax=Onchocerca volvulus TaxID=6282 RepID=A0A8R1TQ74_ONCVO
MWGYKGCESVRLCNLSVYSQGDIEPGNPQFPQKKYKTFKKLSQKKINEGFWYCYIDQLAATNVHSRKVDLKYRPIYTSVVLYYIPTEIVRLNL